MDLPVFAARSAAALALTTLFASAPTASGILGCEARGHCHFPRWIPSESAPFEEAGSTVALHGDVAVLGAPVGDAVYVYERAGAGWAQIQRIETPGTVGGSFGSAIGLHDDLLVVGARYDDSNGPDVGAAFVYERGPGGFSLAETLLDATPTDFQNFGWEVAVSATWVAIGSPDDGAGQRGRVHTYLRGELGLVPSIQISSPATGGQFGSALALHENRLVVGDYADDTLANSAGRIRFYEISPIGTLFLGSLTPAEAEASDWFGYDVAYEGGYIVVGAHGDDDMGSSAGAAYVVEYDPGQPGGSTLSVRDKITGCDSQAFDNFANAVDISGNDIAIGASLHDGEFDAGGVAYVYSPDIFGGSWVLNDRIAPADGAPFAWFGADVAIDGTGVVVGANGVVGNGTLSGAGYFVSLAPKTVPGGECPCDSLASSTSLGGGKPGSVGIPELSSNSVPVPGQNDVLALKNALVGASPFLLWGLDQAAIPFDEGILHMSDPHLVPMPVVSGLGQVGIGWTVPSNPAICGVSIYVQAMFIDPGASGGYYTAQSNGLELVIGY